MEERRGKKPYHLKRHGSPAHRRESSHMAGGEALEKERESPKVGETQNTTERMLYKDKARKRS